MTTSTILIDGKKKKVFGIYGSERMAKGRYNMETRGGTAVNFTKLGIRKVHVGKSVDPAYSDKDGYAWVVYWK